MINPSQLDLEKDLITAKESILSAVSDPFLLTALVLNQTEADLTPVQIMNETSNVSAELNDHVNLLASIDEISREPSGQSAGFKVSFIAALSRSKGVL